MFCQDNVIYGVYDILQLLYQCKKIEMICNACEREDKKQPGDYWCETCIEYLCTTCKLHHGKLKFTSHHFVLPKADKEKVSDIVLKIPVTCPVHYNQPLTIFCGEHQIVVCDSCSELDHGNCSNLQTVKDVVKEDPLKRYRDKSSEMKSLLEASKEEKNKEKIGMDAEELKIKEEILKFRKEIDDKLDSLQNQLLENLKTQHQERLTNVNDARRKLDNLLTNLNTFDQDVNTVKTHVKGEQLFPILLSLKNTIKGLVEDIDNTSNESNITLIKWVKSGFLDTVTTLGRIVSSTSSQVSDSRQDNSNLRNKSADRNSNLTTPNQNRSSKRHLVSIDHTERGEELQIPQNRTNCLQTPDSDLIGTAHGSIPNDAKKTPKKTKTIHLKTHINVPSMLKQNTTVTCCCFYGDNIVIADSSKVYVCSQSNQVLSTVQRHVTDVHCTQNGRLLISIENDGVYEWLPHKSGVDCLRLFLQDEKCSKISSYKDKIVILFGKKSVRIVDINGKIQKRIAASSPPSFLCCDDQGRFFHTSQENDAVTCYDIEGTTLYRFKHRVLLHAHGIATDAEGHLYVCGYGSTNVLKISTDGKGHSVFLSEEDGINEPLCIDINKSTRQLMLLHSNQAEISIYTM